MIERTKPIAESKNFIVLDKYTQAWDAANQYQNNFYTGHTIKTGIDLRFSETWGMRIEAETVDLSSGSGVSAKLFDQQRYSISILRIGLELDEPPKELKRKLLNDYEGPRRRLGSSLSNESP